MITVKCVLDENASASDKAQSVITLVDPTGISGALLTIADLLTPLYTGFYEAITSDSQNRESFNQFMNSTPGSGPDADRIKADAWSQMLQVQSNFIHGHP